MARPPVPYVGAMRSHRNVFMAATRKAAGQYHYDHIDADEQVGSSPQAMARYVAPLCYCPEQRVLWFTMLKKIRLLHPAWAPAELLPEIPEAAYPIDLSVEPPTYDVDLTPPPGVPDVEGEEARLKAMRVTR